MSPSSFPKVPYGVVPWCAWHLDVVKMVLSPMGNAEADHIMNTIFCFDSRSFNLLIIRAIQALIQWQIIAVLCAVSRIAVIAPT